jgi:hypothetical protein
MIERKASAPCDHLIICVMITARLWNLDPGRGRSRASTLGFVCSQFTDAHLAVYLDALEKPRDSAAPPREREEAQTPSIFSRCGAPSCCSHLPFWQSFRRQHAQLNCCLCHKMTCALENDVTRRLAHVAANVAHRVIQVHAMCLLARRRSC